jgi:UDP-N-acetylmuramate--alanine ligase
MDFKGLLSQRAKVYCIGIKGTGVCAMAELLHHGGLSVSGSDHADVFYTDSILKQLKIPYYENFSAIHVPPDAAMVIHSAAYSADTNPEMAEAVRMGIPLLKYTDALGQYSALFDSTGIAGVHGKTTTTAITGVLFRAVKLPARVLAGSAVPAFRGGSTLNMGEKYFAAETCEYRRHFLAFNPKRIILTSVESDHQDYYPTYEDIRDAFIEYALKLPSGGELLYCADDKGACEVTELVLQKRADITAIPYGFNAEGDYAVSSYEVQNGRTCFKVAGFPKTVFKLRIPGRHCVLDAAAALALTHVLVKKEWGANGWTSAMTTAVQNALESFTGSRRRTEILGEKEGVLFIDDYGHHPSAIRTTLNGFREFYPERRIIVSFMSHTYTRTAALLDEFADSLSCADIVFLHKIYASAREEYTGGVNGQTLFEKTKELFEKNGNAEKVFYVEEPEDAVEQLKAMLQEKDLFITMGAGDNWKLGKKLLAEFTVDNAVNARGT